MLQAQTAHPIWIEKKCNLYKKTKKQICHQLTVQLYALVSSLTSYQVAYKKYCIFSVLEITLN